MFQYFMSLLYRVRSYQKTRYPVHPCSIAKTNNTSIRRGFFSILSDKNHPPPPATTATAKPNQRPKRQRLTSRRETRSPLLPTHFFPLSHCDKSFKGTSQYSTSRTASHPSFARPSSHVYTRSITASSMSSDESMFDGGDDDSLFSEPMVSALSCPPEHERTLTSYDPGREARKETCSCEEGSGTQETSSTKSRRRQEASCVGKWR